jgi:hypothetical protein
MMESESLERIVLGEDIERVLGRDSISRHQ